MHSRPAKILAALALTLFMVATPAEANSISFSGTTPSGMVTVSFSLSSTALVNFNWNSGFEDAVFSLFDSAGAHVITADDHFPTSDPKLTQTLGPGSYYLLTSYFTPVTYYLIGLGGTNPAGGTDGTNIGLFWIGPGTLAGAQNAVNSDVSDFRPETFDYDFTIDAGELNVLSATATAVPEPGTLMLLGAGVAGIAAVVRRRRTV